METTMNILIGARPSELYRACTDLESLPKRLGSVRSVKMTGATTSHWVVKGPADRTLEWDAEWTRLEPDRRIAWSTTGEDDVKTSGQITFTPMPHDQTELTVMMKVVSEEIEAAREEMERLLHENLRSLKSSVEKKR